MKLLNQPAPAPLKESVRCAEQNLYARAKELVGDRDPRSHEFSIQARAFDANKSGSGTGLGVLLALGSALLEKNLKSSDGMMNVFDYLQVSLFCPLDMHARLH
jgi:ATP-dependent Lon protease